MKSRFKSNDFFAILIAVALIAIGFVLLFIHQQSSSNEEHVMSNPHPSGTHSFQIQQERKPC